MEKEFRIAFRKVPPSRMSLSEIIHHQALWPYAQGINVCGLMLMINFHASHQPRTYAKHF